MFSVSLLLIAPLALAIPAPSPLPRSVLSSLDFLDRNFSSHHCDVKTVAVPLPANLTVSSGESTSLITVGRGVQNYTCQGGTYVTAGALANLYDVSCVFAATDKQIPASTIADFLPKVAFHQLSYPDKSGLPVLIHHYFEATPNAASGISPVFASNTDKVVLKRDSASNAPNPTKNIQWLKLVALPNEGSLAKTVYRLDTVSGQPPASCSKNGTTKSVQYAAIYWFTK